LDPTTDPTDRDLLKRFVERGDRDALGTLAERHEMHLLGLAKGLLGGDADLALEAVQNAWVKVIRYGASFRDRCAVGTWLYRIVVNQSRDLRRRERRRATSEESPPIENPMDTAEAETRARMIGAVGALPDHQREVILLCYHADLTHESAARILDIPIGTLKSRLHAALTSLRGSLAKEHAR